MEKSLPITKARDQLSALPERLSAEAVAVAVTRCGEPVLAILPWDLYESLIETLEILSDNDLMAHVRQSLSEAAKGDLAAWKTIKQDACCSDIAC